MIEKDWTLLAKLRWLSAPAIVIFGALVAIDAIWDAGEVMVAALDDQRREERMGVDIPIWRDLNALWHLHHEDGFDYRFCVQIVDIRRDQDRAMDLPRQDEMISSMGSMIWGRQHPSAYSLADQ